MKIAFIFGKGIEGCGVTRGANIFEEWLVNKGHETSIIDFDNNQNFGRAGDTTWKGPIHRVEKSYTVQDAADVIKEVNSCDIAIVHSMPTRKQQDYVDRFREFLEQVHDPIIVVHDHGITKHNINMIPQAAEIFSMADIGVVQSFEGYGRDAYTALDAGIDDRIVENPIWVRMNEYNQYRKSFEERRKHFLYIGRMSSLKDPAMIPRIEPHMDMNEWDLSLIGCEKSISSISMLTKSLEDNPAPYTEAFKGKILIHSLNKAGEYNVPNSERKKENTTMNAYDRYKYGWGMEQLGESMASWCGYRLKDPKEYGHRMEYTVIESFLLTLPVISKHFAENATSPDGKLWGTYDGPLVSQAREEGALAEELNRIANNKDEWNERTTACREIINKFNNIDNIGQQFLDFVLTKGKRNDKINFVDKISEYFPSASDRRARGEVLITSANSVLTKTPFVLIDGKQNEIKEPKDVGATLEGFF
jgi:hypothetical protein